MDKKLKATHEGKLKIGDVELNVAVLEDGTRIITQSAVFKAFGRTKRGRSKDDIRVLNRPTFIDAKNLQPFIDGDLDRVLITIEYVINREQKYRLNAIVAFLLFLIFMGFPGWILAFLYFTL